MSAGNVHGFVQNRNRGASPAVAGQAGQGKQTKQPVRADRAGAQGMKIPLSSTASAKLSSTASAPGYTSNPAAARKTYPVQQYHQHQEHAHPRDGLDGSTVDSHFDDTISTDIGFHPNQANYASNNGYYENGVVLEDLPNSNRANYAGSNDYYENEEELEELPRPEERYQHHTQSQRTQQAQQHRLVHKKSQSPMVNLNAEQEAQRQMQSSGISGRFESQQSQFRNLELRPLEDQASGQQAQGSKKRPHSGERNAPPSTILEERSSQLDQLEDGLEDPPEHTFRAERLEDEDEDGQTPSNSPRKSCHVQDPPISQRVPRKHETPVPDYNDGELQKMDYSRLEKESWDRADVKKKIQLSEPRDTSTLQEKMEHYVFDEAQDAQEDFFGQLSTSDWEEGGDWFIERFSDVMNKIKNKRKEKKTVTMKYEAEVSAREKVVRGKSENLDKEFRDMRVGGEGILRGKMI